MRLGGSIIRATSHAADSEAAHQDSRSCACDRWPRIYSMGIQWIMEKKGDLCVRLGLSEKNDELKMMHFQHYSQAFATSSSVSFDEAGKGVIDGDIDACARKDKDKEESWMRRRWRGWETSRQSHAGWPGQDSRYKPSKEGQRESRGNISLKPLKGGAT